MITSQIADLAIAGGTAEFREPLHVGRPNIGNPRELMRLLDVIWETGRVTNRGPYVKEFEARVADKLGVKHCIAMCNGTIALEIAIRALGMEGEVILPSFTFIATAHALQWQQITPVFCDIDPRTYNIDPNRVEELITSRTTGIIGVHLFGRPCDVDALTEIAQRRNLRLMFDAAHAFASSHKGVPVGSFGDAEVLSFHATKCLNTLEGGAIVTNNDALAAQTRLMKNFGFAGLDNVINIGTNGKMSEVNAAVGLTNLYHLDDFLAANRRNYDCYVECLGEIPGIDMMSYDCKERRNYQYVVVEVDEREAGISRDLMVDVLQSENVLARRYFYPGCHRMEPYRASLSKSGFSLLETERLCERIMVLPTGISVDTNQIRIVCDLIRFAVSHAAAIKDIIAQ